MFCISDAAQHPSIAGLHNCQLDFLGLLNCAYNACSRENLPSAQVLLQLVLWTNVGIMSCSTCMEVRV